MKNFVDFIFDGMTDDETVLIAKSDDGFVHAPWGSRAIDQWMHAGSCVYVNTATVKPVPTGEFMPRKSENCVCCYVVVCDDMGTKIDASIMPEPTYKLETSEDNYQYGYVLAEPTEDMAYVSRLIDALIKGEYSDPGAKGFNRLVRVPGSLHETGFKAVLRSMERERLFKIEDLASVFGVTVAAAGRTYKGGVVKDFSVEDDDMLPFIGEIHGVRGDWVDVVCPWAHEHTTGEITAGYSPLGMGLGSLGASRQFHCLHGHCAGRGIREFEEVMTGRGWGGVVKCDLPDHQLAEGIANSDPLPFSRPVDIDELLARSVLIAGASVCDVVALQGGSPSYDLRLQAWGSAWAHLGRSVENGVDKNGEVKEKFVRARALLEAGVSTLRAERYVSIPHVLGEDGYSSAYMGAGGDQVVNTYAPIRHCSELDASYLKFCMHLQYLVPDDWETVRDMLAFKLQNPRKRGYGILLVTATKGTGRNTLFAILKGVWGRRAVEMTLDAFLGNAGAYNDEFDEAQLVMVPEAKSSEGSSTYNSAERLKERVDIAPTWMAINAKYGVRVQQQMYYNVLMASQHAGSLPLEMGDRRMAVFSCAEEVKNAGWYDDLHAICLSPVSLGSVWAGLMARDVSEFEYKIPPMTRAKQTAILSSQSVGEMLLEKFIGDRELYARVQLAREIIELDFDEQLGASDKQINWCVSALWATMTPLSNTERARVRFDGSQRYVRAHKNRDYWMRQYASGELGKRRVHEYVNRKL